MYAICETHLCNDDTISVDGYQWFGHNRTVLSGRAISGSGVLGFSFHMKYLSNIRQRWLIKAPTEYYGWLSLRKTILTLAYCYVCATFPPKVRHGVMYHESFMIVNCHNCTYIMTVIPQWYLGNMMVALVWKVIAMSQTFISGYLLTMYVISLGIIL